MLTNPALNYVQFLLRAILPMVLHVIIAITGGYAVGSEFGRRSVRDWMAAAGGDPLTAIVGKLAPYLGIFLMLMVVIAFTIHGAFGGFLPWRFAAAGRFGRPAHLGLSLGRCAVPAAGAQSLLRLVAHRHLLLARLRFRRRGLSAAGDERLRALLGRPAAAALVHADPVPTRPRVACRPSIPSNPLAVLAGLTLAFFALTVLRLRAVAAKPLPYEEEEPESSGRLGIAGAFAAEYRRALRNRGALGLIVLAPIIYGALYPQPYLGQLIRAIPIAVVDEDSSEVSRRLIQALNAHEALQVVARPNTLADAQAALARRDVFAIVDIPAGTERDVLAGRKARVPAYVDSVYFLLYNRTVQGVLESSGAVTAEVLSGDARSDGSLYRAALARSSPVDVLSQPLFNPTGGVCELHRPGRLHADPAADPVHGRGDPGRGAPPRSLGCRGSRGGSGSSLVWRCRARCCFWSCCRGSTASRRRRRISGTFWRCCCPSFSP